MLMLILGVSLWSLAHLFKRLMPAMRERMGNVGKLVVTLVLIGSIVLMIAGYPQATGSVWWVRQPLWVSVNNLLVLLAVYLMVSSTMKTRVTGLIRHPQLTAVKAWVCGPSTGQWRCSVFGAFWRLAGVGCGVRNFD